MQLLPATAAPPYPAAEGGSGSLSEAETDEEAEAEAEAEEKAPGWWPCHRSGAGCWWLAGGAYGLSMDGGGGCGAGGAYGLSMGG